MQEENQNFSEYFERTRALAEKLGIPVVELPDHIGVSKAMLFAYRKGKYPISWKAWRKLEAAELAAGIGVSYEKQPEKSDRVEELPPAGPESLAVPAECPAGIARLEELLLDVQSRLIRLEEAVMKERKNEQ